MLRDSAEGKTCTWCHRCRETFPCEEMVERIVDLGEACGLDYALFCKACAKEYDEAYDKLKEDA